MEYSFEQIQNTLSSVTPKLRMVELQASDEQEFLSMVNISKDIHNPWVYAPDTSVKFKELLDINLADILLLY